MSAVINIAHPIVSTKPPIKKCPPEKANAINNDASKKSLLRHSYSDGPMDVSMDKQQKDGNERRNVDSQGKGQNADTAKSGDRKKENIILRSNVDSIEQLCNIINDLEKSVADETHELEKDLDINSVYNCYSEVDQRYKNQLQPEKDCSNDKRGSANGSTYEDIMSFLASLDDGHLNAIPRANETDLNANAVIQEIFTTSKKCSPCFEFNPLKNYFPSTIKDDLATAQLQLEEKEASIALLKNELKIEREALCEKLNSLKKKHASKLEAQEKKYQAIVKRHQKFVEQVISEKRDLTEKCNSLAQKIKEVETKAQKDLKVCTERHLVELQRAKEHFAAAEKIRRERWLEARTSKIKEMTVRGLEPELRSMVEQHQVEIQEIRSAHMKELQDTELRIIRRSNQQLEQLRLELTDSHEKILTNEKNILWTRYKEKLDEQEAQFRAERAKFADELERERMAFKEEQAKRDKERDAIVQETHTRLQKELEDTKRQQQVEKETLRQNLQAEWAAWLDNYKKQQTLKVERVENRMQEECNRERDRQIELAIARIEKETQQTRAVLQQSYESKLRSFKEKYAMELRAATDNENTYREKLLSTEKRLANTDSKLQIIENKLKECMATLSNKDELIAKLTMERDNAKSIARQEIEAEKRILEEKIASLYQELTQNSANKEMLLSQLYSRVKLILTQKVLVIKNVTKELEESRARCEHLERLLDQQRKEYLLKSL